MPIESSELQYLREATLDRDQWAWTTVLYFVPNRTAMTGLTNRMTKEAPPGGDAGYIYDDPIELPAQKVVRGPTTDTDVRTQGATRPEHQVSFKFGIQNLLDAGIDPKPGDKIVCAEVAYRVAQRRQTKQVANSKRALDVEYDVNRIEEIDNPDVPF